MAFEQDFSRGRGQIKEDTDARIEVGRSERKNVAAIVGSTGIEPGFGSLPTYTNAGPPTPLPTVAATPTVAAVEALSQPTLLTYNTVERLLAGDPSAGSGQALLHTVTITDVRSDLAGFPSDWPVVGVGTTVWIGRNGEMMPDGTAGNLHFWWADPSSPSEADVVDLAMDGHLAAGFPFLGLAIGDPTVAVTWTLQDVANVHAWLEEKLGTSGIDMAGVQLRGEFGPMKTTVAYNIPLTGLDLSGGYVAEDVFRFGEYITATWTINGVYAADPALQRVVSTAGHPLHLHGYQTDTMLGGHVGSASAISVTATVWPLDRMVIRRGELRNRTRMQGVVAVLTDFGTTGFYVGAMEGAMYTANPQVRVATITNIPGSLPEEAGLAPGDLMRIAIGERPITATFATTYEDVPEGNWLALINAEQVVEIARNLANAAETVGVSTGVEVRLER